MLLLNKKQTIPGFVENHLTGNAISSIVSFTTSPKRISSKVEEIKPYKEAT
jgi:hypothetical protein